MIFKTIITRALGFVLLIYLVACQNEEPANRGPSPALPTDTKLGHGYVRRDGAIHFIGGGITGTGDNATRIDRPSRKLLRKVEASKFGPFTTAEGLDVASFEALSEEYTRDVNRVYYKIFSNGEFVVIVLPEADPASFELLGGELTRDKKRVWYRDEIQPETDPATVERLKCGPVYRDKNSVFYQYHAIPCADPASTKHIGSGYFADSKRVYWGPDPVPGADPSSFKVMGDSFIAKDGSKVYRSGVHLPGYDVESFELILHNEAGFQIFSDKNGIQLNNMTFPRSKPGKVEIIDDTTVQAGDLVHLVNTYRYTPVTLFKEEGRLMAETPAYEPGNDRMNGMVTAEVSADGLRNIRISPLPGGNKAPSVPEWQLRVFKDPHLVQRMIQAGNLID
jgi:hypothetical protein